MVAKVLFIKSILRERIYSDHNGHISVNNLVIIPSYNEEKNLAAVIGEIKTFLPDFDIAVVDDGSRDRTRDVAIAAGAAVVSHPVNMGYGAAVQTGFRYACTRKYSCVVLMDADGQHDARDAPALVRGLIEYGADVAIGSRFIAKTGYKTSIARFIGRNLFSLLTHVITHKIFIDITSGFRALNARAVEYLSGNYPVDFPDAEVLITLLLNGFTVVEIPATFRHRTMGQSMFSLSRKLYYPFKGLLAVLVVVMRQILRGKEESQCL